LPFITVKLSWISSLPALSINASTAWKSSLSMTALTVENRNRENLQLQEQGYQGAVSRVTPVWPGQYLSFPDIDDVFKPGMYQRLLDMAVTQDLDVATCNGNYVWETTRNPRARSSLKTNWLRQGSWLALRG
jgi:hypothetical protein